ncbi:hypothetical protein FB451DRAFT_1185244 [Mycena latifolia]|nr:hypothetical protein FB451DRAFT_1185244 [Mycena latifolia]
MYYSASEKRNPMQLCGPMRGIYDGHHGGKQCAPARKGAEVPAWANAERCRVPLHSGRVGGITDAVFQLSEASFCVSECILAPMKHSRAQANHEEAATFNTAPPPSNLHRNSAPFVLPFKLQASSPLSFITIQRTLSSPHRRCCPHSTASPAVRPTVPLHPSFVGIISPVSSPSTHGPASCVSFTQSCPAPTARTGTHGAAYTTRALSSLPAGTPLTLRRHVFLLPWRCTSSRRPSDAAVAQPRPSSSAELDRGTRVTPRWRRVRRTRTRRARRLAGLRCHRLTQDRRAGACAILNVTRLVRPPDWRPRSTEDAHGAHGRNHASYAPDRRLGRVFIMERGVGVDADAGTYPGLLSQAAAGGAWTRSLRTVPAARDIFYGAWRRTTGMRLASVRAPTGAVAQGIVCVQRSRAQVGVGERLEGARQGDEQEDAEEEKGLGGGRSRPRAVAPPALAQADERTQRRGESARGGRGEHEYDGQEDAIGIAEGLVRARRRGVDGTRCSFDVRDCRRTVSPPSVEKMRRCARLENLGRGGLGAGAGRRGHAGGAEGCPRARKGACACTLDESGRDGAGHEDAAGREADARLGRGTQRLRRKAEAHARARRRAMCVAAAALLRTRRLSARGGGVLRAGASRRPSFVPAAGGGGVPGGGGGAGAQATRRTRVSGGLCILDRVVERWVEERRDTEEEHGGPEGWIIGGTRARMAELTLAATNSASRRAVSFTRASFAPFVYRSLVASGCGCGGIARGAETPKTRGAGGLRVFVGVFESHDSPFSFIPFISCDGEKVWVRSAQATRETEDAPSGRAAHPRAHLPRSRRRVVALPSERLWCGQVRVRERLVEEGRAEWRWDTRAARRRSTNDGAAGRGRSFITVEGRDIGGTRADGAARSFTRARLGAPSRRLLRADQSPRTMGVPSSRNAQPEDYDGRVGRRRREEERATRGWSPLFDCAIVHRACGGHDGLPRARGVSSSWAVKRGDGGAGLGVRARSQKEGKEGTVGDQTQMTHMLMTRRRAAAGRAGDAEEVHVRRDIALATAHLEGRELPPRRRVMHAPAARRSSARCLRLSPRATDGDAGNLAASGATGTLVEVGC